MLTLYTVHSVHYDVLQVWYHQQVHNSTMNVLFLFLTLTCFGVVILGKSSCAVICRKLGESHEDGDNAETRRS